MSALPIDSVLPRVRAALRTGRDVVLQAPPGAGKTTRVPLALAGEPWAAGRRILVLEPRRLAARAAAGYMAKLLGETAGRTVGYRIRFETRAGPLTRIEVVTEGILERMLLDDPALDGVAAVLFDEFHERSIHADVGLAMTLHTRALFRPDLRIVVMSATLDAGAVAGLLDGAPVLTAAGTSHPVETRYDTRPAAPRIAAAVAGSVRRALATEPGDILVFLPGAGEIRAVARLLAEDGAALRGPVPVDVLPLYGDLPQDAQERAIAPSPPDRRKVVLATAIAETSLTIEGVRVVIDSGLMRVPRFSPRSGLTRLETVTVTRDAADQRRGRAGRVAPGVCYRLWTEAEHAGLVPHRSPEILEADLAPVALALAAWGAADPRELAWLDPPPAAAWAQARELLRELGALDGAGAPTAHGRRMAALPLHPRLAHMVLVAGRLGRTRLAYDLAALLGERDPLRGDGPPDPDVRLRLDLLTAARRGGPTAGADVDRGALRRALAAAEHWRRRLARATTAEDNPPDDDAHAGLLLAHAYPDRIAQRRPNARGAFLLRSGRGATLDPASALAAEEFIVAAEVDERAGAGRIFLAAPVARSEIEREFADRVVREQRIEWDPARRAARALRTVRLGALVLEQSPIPDPDPAALAAALAAGIRSEGLAALPWTDASRGLRERLSFAHALDGDAWPDVSDAALADSLERWLGGVLHGLRATADLSADALHRALETLIPPGQRRALDALAPTHILVPSGSRVAIDYSRIDAPFVSVKLQEVFGLLESPRIAHGRVPLTFQLLSPANRPVQVTRDLASFWQTGYFDVRKDLRGRYPKHHWPADPRAAVASRGPKRRR